jgi:hypothetical protein
LKQPLRAAAILSNGKTIPREFGEKGRHGIMPP